MAELSVADKIIQLRDSNLTLTSENQTLQTVNGSLVEQNAKLLTVQEEEKRKHEEEVKTLHVDYKRLLDEQQARFDGELEKINKAYVANTEHILSSLDQANADRDKAHAESEEWKTKFNEYIKDNLNR